MGKCACKKKDVSGFKYPRTKEILKMKLPKMMTGFKIKKPVRERIHHRKHLQPAQIGGTIWKSRYRYYPRQNV